MERNISFHYFIIMVSYIILVSSLSSAQSDTSAVTRLILQDGSELKGYIIEERDSLIIFRSVSGIKMEIDTILVKKNESIAGEISDGELIRYDPNRTRLLFGPTARTLKKGNGYFSTYEIFFPSLAYGVTDFITLSGGVSLVPGVDEQVIYAGAKVGIFESEVVTLAGGFIYAHVSDTDFGIAYGVVSIGSQRIAGTLGIGLGYEDWEFSDTPVIILGGEVQVSNSIKLLTENWLPPDADYIIISLAIRFFGDNIAADFGLVTSTDVSTEGFPFLPWVGFVYNF
jgi:hypothetical protein